MKYMPMRTAALALLTALAPCAPRPAAAQTVIINEIMYHPQPDMPEDTRLEWVELHNPGTNIINLNGWRFSKGIDYTFPNLLLHPGGYVALVAEINAFETRHPTAGPAIGNFTGTLGNNGETLQLDDAAGNEVDHVDYATEGDWAIRQRGPFDQNHQGWEWQAEHDGQGKSLERIHPGLGGAAGRHGQNWAASTANNGTPGLVNSVRATNTAPHLLDLAHAPLVPTSTDPVTLTVRVLAPAATGLTVRVWHRVDNTGATFASTTMTDDGLGGDATGGDGLYTATLPARANNAVVEYYVEARDAQDRVRTWPAPVQPTGTQLANALYQVDDNVYGGSQPIYRLVLTEAERAELQAIPGSSPDRESNAQMNSTLITQEASGAQLRYNCGVRNRGNGSRSANPPNYRVNVANDRPWNGQRAMNLNTQFTHAQVFGSALFQKSGLAMANSRAVQVRVNGVNRASSGSPQFGSYAHNEELNGDFAAAHFPLDSGGDIYRGVRLDNGSAHADLDWLGTTNKNSYTNVYSKANNLSADNWTNLIEVLRVLGTATDAEFADEAPRVLDVRQAMLYFAVNTLCDNNETSLANGNGDDYAMYIGRADPRLKLLGYDVDSIVGFQGSSPTAQIFRMINAAFCGGNTPCTPPNSVAINRLMTNAAFAPLYFATLKQLLDTTFSQPQFDPLVDRTLGDFVTPGTISAMKSFMTARRNHVRSLLPQTLRITTNVFTFTGGYVQSGGPTLNLSGSANIIDTRSVRVNGALANWAHLTGAWSLSGITLQPGINRVLVQALNGAAQEIARQTLDVWYDDGTLADLGGNIAANTTLTAAGGPYNITSSLTVASNVTLTIAPGATLYFGAGLGLTVNGRLNAQGTDTQRIRFTRAPGAGATNSWAGLTFANTSASNQVSFADIEYAGSGAGGQSIRVQNSVVYLDRLTFSGTTANYIDHTDSSMLVRNCDFPTLVAAEHIHGVNIPTNGFVLIEGNRFGTTTGLNDIIDFSNAQRPFAILQVVSNTFSGASDDVLDLDGCDAHIEGNLFLHVHNGNFAAADTSSAISYGRDGSRSAHIVAVRNFFYDVDHAVLAKEGGSLTFEQNTAVGVGVALINFDEPLRRGEGVTNGVSAALDGNVFWNPPGWNGTNFQNAYQNDPEFGTVQVSVNRSLMAATDFLDSGTGNLNTDPRLANLDSNTITEFTVRSDFQLLAGSPAAGSGANGLDMGAAVPAGASLSGEPPALTYLTGATLTVGGPGITDYRFRLDNGVYGAETPVGSPLVLAGLANGVHTVRVIGKNSAGVWQSTNQPALRSWTVSNTLARVRLNEILARNVTAQSVAGEFPDLIELLNDSSSPANLSGVGLTDDPAVPFKFAFPPATMLGGGELLVLYGDSESGPGHHLGFGLNQNGDALYLFSSSGVLLDSNVFGVQLADLSIGRDRHGAWGLSRPSFGLPNVAQPVGAARSLQINEWLADAQGQFTEDFIELFNPDPQPVDLGGLFLSDAPAGAPGLHRVAPLCFIAGGGYLAFTADGQPEAGADHLGFKLSALQGFIGLFAADLSLIDCVSYGPQAPDVSEGRRPSGSTNIARLTQPTPGAGNPGGGGGPLVTTTTLNLLPLTAVWRYDASGGNLGSAWRAAGYDDSAWASGPALLYNETSASVPEKNTFLSFTSPQQTTFYFRTRVVVTTNLAGFSLVASTWIDDGAIFYVNGVEVSPRVRMPSGAVTYLTAATSTPPGGGDASLETFTWNVSLPVGTNVLAVEVHQAALPSSDIVWGMALDAVRSVTNVAPFNIVINEVLANNRSVTNGAGSVQGMMSSSIGTDPLADWVELHNGGGVPADLGGMGLTDVVGEPARWVFPPGVLLPAGGFLVVRFDGNAPASSNAAGVLNTGFGLGANGDEVYLFESPANGLALVDGVTFGPQAADYSLGRFPDGGEWGLGQPSAGAANLASPLGSASAVRVNEWLANAANGDEDWFELFNPNAQPVAIGGLYLTDNLASKQKFKIRERSFIGVGEFAFARFFAANGSDTDHTGFSLNASLEAVGLFTAAGVLVDGISFTNQQNNVSEGRFPDGSATVVRFPGTATPAASNLRALTDVVVSEGLSHSDLPLEDAIELFNLTSTSVDVSGWWLSDSKNEPQKFRIPAGTVIAAGGRVVFYEYQFNEFPNVGANFSLNSAHGDEVFLSTADEAGNLTGYRTGVEFGAAANGVAFGRYLSSVGVEFTALSARTFGADGAGTVAEFRAGSGLPNAYPLVGPVVVNEIFYHPPDMGTNDNSGEEFIELQNISGGDVTLFDPLAATNTWRLRDGVDFDFPPGERLPAGGFLLVVSFDPATNAAATLAWRTKFGVPGGVPVFGPWSGKLANDGENVELYFPDAPELPGTADAGFVPFIEADKIKYGDNAPWPAAADGNTNGLGASLQRRVPSEYGNDPVNWLAAAPTAGRTNAAAGAASVVPPVITSLTPDLSVAAGSNVTLTVAASGTNLSFQWRFNGAAIAGATGTNLVLPNIQATNAGIFSVVVANAGGAASGAVRVEVQLAPLITRQPISRVLPLGSTAAFTVTVRGTPPVTHQWQRSETNLPGATNASLLLGNAQFTDEGSYRVIVANAYGAATSAVATLTINAPPQITTQPQGLTVFAGADVTFHVIATGTAPLGFLWRFNGTPLPGATNDSLALTNVQGPAAGNYTVLVTNAVGQVVSAVATLNVILPPSVTVVAADAVATEPGADTGRLVFTRTGDPALALTVNYTVSGTAQPGADYLALGTSLTFAAGALTTNLSIVPLDDPDLEGNESVRLTLGAGSGYVVGTPASATVTIFDEDNDAPTVMITSPAEGALFTAPVDLTLAAMAGDASGGTVAKVEFFYNVTNFLGEALTAPYTITWSNAPAGTYALLARATDNLGSTADSVPVTILVNARPFVGLTAPAGGAFFTVPANLTLAASAVDSDGTVTNVLFYEGNNLLGEDATIPYSLVWSNVPVGAYTLTARAVDDRGTPGTSAPVTVTVALPSAGFADHFTNRGALFGYTNNVTGNSAAFSREAGEPRHDDRNGTRSAWLSWLAPASGDCTVDTFGSGFDTVLAVYTGTVLAALTPVASDDDTGGLQSQVTFTAAAGVQYHLAVDGYGSGSGGAITLHLTLPNPAPIISAQPAAVLANPGATVQFSVTASGPGPLFYTWLHNGGPVPGGTAATLTLTNVQPVNEGIYAVIVSNAASAVLSTPAPLTLRRPPEITVPPQDAVADEGGTVQFTASVTGTAPLARQWRLNGTNLPGATLATLTRTNVQYPHGGSYTLHVTNAAGSVTSPEAELIVRPRIVGVERLPDGAVRLTWHGVPGRGHEVQVGTNFTDWTTAATVVNPAVAASYTDTNAPAATFRAYRVRVAP